MINAAIVILTRGYHDVRWYDRLLVRNNHIYENFNKKLEKQYPLIIFHEGNISEHHQTFIRNNDKNEDVRFVNVASSFKLPDNVDINKMQDPGFHVGYRIMCAFNSYHIWNYTKEFDYIFRIDEDTFIGELSYDPFAHMQENQLDYMVGRFCYETHSLTNQTIPAYVHSVLGDKWKESDYDQTEMWVPYTNLYLARTKFFLQENVEKFLKQLTNEPMFYYNRWGDHVVSGIVLKAFKGKVATLQNFAYLHGSHHCVTQNGRAMQGLLSEYEAKVFDCVPTGKESNHYVARELENEYRRIN